MQEISLLQNPQIVMADLSDIEDNLYQARVEYSETAIVLLAANIKEHGLLQYPAARKVGDKYQLAFGHRRKRACEMNGYKSMPLLVMDLNERQMFEISLSENLKREDLNPIEKARALKRYMDEFKATSVQAAKLFGIPESTIRGTVRLLNLPEETQKQVETGEVSQTRARVFLQRSKPVAVIDPSDEFDLRDALSMLVFNEVRNVTDEQLFKKVKEVFKERDLLKREVEIRNQRSVDVLKLRSVVNR